ncbi:hypothetical protein SOVF_202420, partial [Spinacia oleracea]
LRTWQPQKTGPVCKSWSLSGTLLGRSKYRGANVRKCRNSRLPKSNICSLVRQMKLIIGSSITVLLLVSGMKKACAYDMLGSSSLFYTA